MLHALQVGADRVYRCSGYGADAQVGQRLARQKLVESIMLLHGASALVTQLHRMERPDRGHVEGDRLRGHTPLDEIPKRRQELVVHLSRSRQLARELGAEIALDVAPGRIFEGHVASVSAGVATSEAARGGLPTAETSQGWLQDPQRFPVIIRFAREEARGYLRVGGQADVVVVFDTGIFVKYNLLGWTQIHNRRSELLASGEMGDPISTWLVARCGIFTS